MATTRKRISGPAMMVLALVLLAIWFGSQALSGTKTVSVDVRDSSNPPVVSTEPSPTAPPAADAPQPSPAPAATEPTTPPLPDGYPGEIPSPTRSTLTGSFSQKSASQQSFVVTYAVPGTVTDVSAGYKTQLTSAGFTIDDLAVLPGADTSGFFGAQHKRVSLTVALAADSDKPDHVVLTINAVVEE